MIDGLIKHIREIAIFKTIYFNIRCLSFRKAIKFPVFIYRYTDIYDIGKGVSIKCKLKTGMIKIGVPELYSLDMRNQRTKWKVEGNVVFNGPAIIGRGSCIRVIGNDAVLSFGSNLIISGRSSIICQKQVSLGNDCLLSWDILLMDTDFHQIVDSNDNVINQSSPITIGNHVWIGCRSTILKGVEIADNVVVAANSVITRSIKESNCIYGGNAKSADVIKRNTNWKHDIIR